MNVPLVEQAKATVEDDDCVKVHEDGETTEDELRRLLHKAIQDRTMAEQKARLVLEQCQRVSGKPYVWERNSLS